MRVIVATEHHFLQTTDGKVYSATHGREYRFWERYLSAFDEVLVVARVKPVKMVDKSLKRADGPAVRFYPLPDFIGPSRGLKVLPKLRKYMQGIAMERGAFILRVPGIIGTLLYLELKKKGKPFAVEVVGDPYDSLNPKAFRSPWAWLVRPLMVQALKAQCRNAIAALYVTKAALQQRYPPRSLEHTFCSDVELPPWIFEDASSSPMEKDFSKSPNRLIFVGTLAQLYKGQDVLLKAFAKCIREGLNLELQIIGDGVYRGYLEKLANKLNIKPRVKFLGQLPHEGVFQKLRESDLFVLPFRQEGLPRAMIEAMACGLPCIGSTVGGIPELLPPEDLVPPDNVEALAKKIQEIISNPDRMRQMAERNRRITQEYHPEVLQARRRDFYQRVRELTEELSNE